jgi:hypothetical protein
MSRFVLLLCVLMGIHAATWAQQIRPGLWEIENSHAKGGPMGELNSQQAAEMSKAMQRAQEAMAKMSPEQRKQLQAMMAQHSGGSAATAAARQGAEQFAPGSKPGAIRVCYTKELLARWEVPMHENGCKGAIQQRSGNVTRYAFECAGPPPSTGEGTITFSSDTAYSSTMVIQRQAQGRPERMEFSSKASFVSADCGKVKPLQAGVGK